MKFVPELRRIGSTVLEMVFYVYFIFLEDRLCADSRDYNNSFENKTIFHKFFAKNGWLHCDLYLVRDH